MFSELPPYQIKGGSARRFCSHGGQKWRGKRVRQGRESSPGKVFQALAGVNRGQLALPLPRTRESSLQQLLTRLEFLGGSSSDLGGGDGGGSGGAAGQPREDPRAPAVAAIGPSGRAPRRDAPSRRRCTVACAGSGGGCPGARPQRALHRFAHPEAHLHTHIFGVGLAQPQAQAGVHMGENGHKLGSLVRVHAAVGGTGGHQ